MPPFLLNIPDSLKQRVSQLAEQDHIPMTQWILLAIAEKVGGSDKYANSKKERVRLAKTTKTVTGSQFKYTQNSRGGFWIESSGGSPWAVPAEQIDVSRGIINEVGRIELGASRDQPKKNSLGDRLLKQFGVNNASYIVPMLRDEQACSVELGSDGRSYWVIKRP